jgi:hypothetical protein
LPRIARFTALLPIEENGINWISSPSKAEGLAEPPNKPFEWTGHHQLSAPPSQAPCLALKGSVGNISKPKSLFPLLDSERLNPS